MKKGIKLNLEKALLIPKSTRYEYEKNKYKVTDDELKKILKDRGSNYGRLRETHDAHKESISKITNSLSKRNIQSERV